MNDEPLSNFAFNFNLRRYSAEIGYVLRGDVYLDLSPFATIRAGAQVQKHCEAPAEAMELYGHVWSAQVSIPSLLMFDGALELYDVQVDALGRQIGTEPGQSSNMTWTASFEGMALSDISRHVIDTHVEPSFLEFHGIL